MVERPAEVRIDWDEWGVPRIEGDDDADVCFGSGYTQATAHATQVLELYGIARGESASLWGADFVDEDVFHAQMGLGAVAGEWWSAQEDSTGARIAAFCDGFNAACQENPELGTTRREALPVVATDVIAHLVRIMVRFATMDPRALAFPYYAPRAASNAWAVSAKRSSTGRAMLLANPHLAWRGFHRWFEFRAVSPGRRCHGVTLLGLPWQTIGFNECAGWTHTVNPVPVLNVYSLDPDTALELDEQEHIIEVRGGESATTKVRRSVHGPVVTAPDGADVAVRIAGIIDHPATGTLEGWWQMSLARDTGELVRMARRYKLPFFNLLAADSRGTTAAAFCATPAVHKKATYDDLLTRMPGDDPDYQWDDVHPATAMPEVVDPECGWVQNVNETPWWYCHPPLNPDAYPTAIAPPPGFIRDPRSAVSRAWLDAHESISPDELLDLKWSARAVLADLILEELCTAARSEPDLVEAADVLTTWDRQARATSPGYPLFYIWLLMSLMAARGAPITDGEPAAGELPTRLADPQAAVDGLRTAVVVMQGLGQPLDACMGDWVKMSDRSMSVPADGGTASVGVMKDMEPVPSADGSWSADYGDTWISLVEFQPEGPPLAQGLLVYGNTTEPSAPAYRSQIDLFATNRLRRLAPLF